MKYVFGLAGDPITLGHIAIVKNIHKHLKDEDKLFILVSNNDEKQYKASVEDRMMVINETMESIFADNMPTILEQRTRMYNFLWEKFKDETDITIVIGEDEWNSLTAGNWQNSDKFLEKYSFLVARRKGEGDLRDADKYRVKPINLYDCDEISSTKIREIFYRNPATKYREVHNYMALATFKAIKEYGLYYQNGDRYDEECVKLAEEYKEKKKKFGWSEPSITADIVAYNGDQVLLIRRKKWPYKNYWAVPGGFFAAVPTMEEDGVVKPADEDLEHAAHREFMEETTLNYPAEKFEQIKTYSHMFDPRLRIVDTAFAVRIHAKDMNKAMGADDAVEAKWFNFNDLPALAFHHGQIIRDFLAKKNMEDDYFENLPINEV